MNDDEDVEYELPSTEMMDICYDQSRDLLCIDGYKFSCAVITRFLDEMQVGKPYHVNVICTLFPDGVVEIRKVRDGKEKR